MHKKFIPNRDISFKKVLQLLFHCDTPFDETDGLIMLDALEDEGRLSEADKHRLHQRLNKFPIIMLEPSREVAYGSKMPPVERFWWFRPEELKLKKSA